MEAMAKVWLREGPLSRREADVIRRTVDPKRIVKLRFVYRDKNAPLRTKQLPLPVKAKARLCAQASREPMAKNGVLKLDSPTVQRVGVMVFLQTVASLE